MTLSVLKQIEQACVVLSPELEQFTEIPYVLLYWHVQFVKPPHDDSMSLPELPMDVELPGVYRHDDSLFWRPWIPLETAIMMKDIL